MLFFLVVPVLCRGVYEKSHLIKVAFPNFRRGCNYFGTVSVAGEMLSAAGTTESTVAGGTVSVTAAVLSTVVPDDSSVLFGLQEIIPIPAARIRVNAIFFIT